MKALAPPAPAIILLGTQLGENIGAAARAMHNFGIADLRLVRPRAGFSRQRAEAAAAGGAALLQRARQFDSLGEAIADLHYVAAASARRRDMNKPVLAPEAAIERIIAAKGGIVFGPERSGLDNEAISLCDAIAEIPAHRQFPSLNLAQAVMIFCYRWHVAQSGGEISPKTHTLKAPAPKTDILNLFAHLEGELDAVDFFRSKEKRPIMTRNLRNIFHRAQLSASEVKALRGVIAALADRRQNKN